MDRYSEEQYKKFAAEPAFYRAQISMQLLEVGREKITRLVVENDLSKLVEILKEKECPKFGECKNTNFEKVVFVQEAFHQKILAEIPKEEETAKYCNDFYNDNKEFTGDKSEKWKGELLWCFREDIKFGEFLDL